MIKGKTIEIREVRLKNRETFWQATNCSIHHGLNGVVDFHNVAQYTREIPSKIKKPLLLFNEEGKREPQYSQQIMDRMDGYYEKAKLIQRIIYFSQLTIKTN